MNDGIKIDDFDFAMNKVDNREGDGIDKQFAEQPPYQLPTNLPKNYPGGNINGLEIKDGKLFVLGREVLLKEDLFI